MINFFHQDRDHAWVRSQSFAELTSQQILSETKWSSKTTSSRPEAWVLDLDSTLFCTAPRNKRVFWRFLREHPQPPMLWMRLWSYLSPLNQKYSIPHTFGSILRHEMNFSEADARLETIQLWDVYKDFWLNEFFLSRNISRDLPYAGAAEFVNSLYKKGYHLVYLTGRDAERGWAGTYQALKSAGFPTGDNTYLRLKPESKMGDLEFKTEAVRRISREFNIKAFIDNEPENLVMFAEEAPASEIIFYHSIMSSRLPSKGLKEMLGSRSAWKLNTFV